MKQSFIEKISELKKLREKALETNKNKLFIVISGAGPAGLIRGIQALLDGNNIQIIEKRSIYHSGRHNVVSLIKETMEILKKYGVYQYLLEKKLVREVNNPISIFVKLCDLELALKAVVDELSMDTLICYDSQVIEIIENGDGTVKLIVNDNHGSALCIHPVDLFIIAEGANSYTNRILLKNHTQMLIPPVEGLLAFFKKQPWQFNHIFKLFTKIYKLFLSHIYFLFRFIVRRDNEIAFSVLTRTPGQMYLAGAFSRKEENNLKALLRDIDALKDQLKKYGSHATRSPEMLALQKNVENKENQLKIYLMNWTYHFLWYANYFKIISLCLGKKLSFLNFGTLYTLDHITLVTNNVQRSAKPSGLIGKMIYLVVGDALTTADTLTGLGCNVSIQTVKYFNELIKNLDQGKDIQQSLSKYDESLNNEIHLLYYNSLNMRLGYRPDTIIGIL